MISAIFSAGSFLLLPGLAFAQGVPHAKAVLVELFTSEGCSSCPPADALLREIEGTTSEGQWIVALSEHVTYWNELGWADPYSAETFTARQQAYGRRLGLVDGVYTPQMVVNGSAQFVGSDRSRLRRALVEQAGRQDAVTLHIVKAESSGGKLQLTFTSSGQAATLFAVIADDHDQTSVPRGENSGRTLSHVAVARSLAPAGRVAAATSAISQKIVLDLPAGYRPGQAHHVVLFAQAPETGRVFGVDAAAI